MSRTSALLVTQVDSKPFGIIDLGPNAEMYFRQRQVIEIYTVDQRPPDFRSDSSYRGSQSEVHPFRGTYMLGLGSTELLTICSLRKDTEDLLVDYFGQFARGDHDAVLKLRVGSPVLSILGYLRR